MVGAGNDKQVSIREHGRVHSNAVCLVPDARGEGIDAT